MRGHRIEPGFQTADGEQIALAYDGESLELSFVDWRAEPARVSFAEAVAFRWQRAEEVGPGEAWDGTTLLLESPWLDAHRRQGEATEHHRHLVLNFNAAGRLDVLCTTARAT